MLEEIRLFFERLREPPPKWPENLSAIDPGAERELRAEFEQHWRLAMQALDEMETKIVDLYDAGADVPAAIDLVDEVVAYHSAEGQTARSACQRNRTVAAEEIVRAQVLRPLTSQPGGVFLGLCDARPVVDGSFQVEALGRGQCSRRNKSSGPPLLKASLKVKRNTAHNQSSGFAIAPRVKASTPRDGADWTVPSRPQLPDSPAPTSKQGLR